jgi:hypothetical protein
MKINKKALRLIDKGLSANTISRLNESQIDTLYSKLFLEVTMVSQEDQGTITRLKNEKKPFEVYEKELEEEEEVTVDPNKETETQDPKQVGPSSDDGFGDETDGMGMFEEKSSASSICHSQVGPKKSRKWQRCVKAVEKSLKEGKNPVSLFLENEIMKIVERNIPPRITKGDLMKYLVEDSPAVAPSKPKTSPTTKPGTKPQKPAHPLKNPNPGEKPAPKAEKVSKEKAKEQVIDLIINLLDNE